MASSENDLPSYDQCVSAAPPPTYRSLFGRIRSWTSRNASRCGSSQNNHPIRQLNENEGSLNHRSVEEGNGENPKTLVVQLLFGLVMTGVSVAGIVIGITNIGHCPVEPFVPVWTVIYGVGILCFLLVGLYSILYKKLIGDSLKDGVFWAAKILAASLLLWLIFGSILVYKHVKQSSLFQGEYTLQCNEKMYEFAFWLLTGSYLLFGGTGVIICCSYIRLKSA